MTIQIQAIFENGLLRPLQAVGLAEQQEVTITIEDNEARFCLPPDRWQAFCNALDVPPRHIPALHKLLTEASILDGTADQVTDSGSA